ncbi:MAG: hypothetical protein QOH36_1350 [Actinomycetota bacterium]|jgi:hypothetical protein|nr:hypothetical protein [Actinomycetota bacterium]MEA2973392.1 hypothetical protein [Actinomycetota bacterium]
MTDPMAGVPDLEAPPEDAFEQSLPAGEPVADELPVDLLPDDLEAPEPDVIEQHQPGPPYEEEDWR